MGWNVWAFKHLHSDNARLDVNSSSTPPPKEGQESAAPERGAKAQSHPPEGDENIMWGNGGGLRGRPPIPKIA